MEAAAAGEIVGAPMAFADAFGSAGGIFDDAAGA